MKKNLIKFISVFIVFAMVITVFAACNNGEEDFTSDSTNPSGKSSSSYVSDSHSHGEQASAIETNDGKIEIYNPDRDYNKDGDKYTSNDFVVEVPEYEKTADVLLSDKKTDYVIVVDESASSTVYGAVKELNYFFNYATGAVFGITTDNVAVWSDAAKYICLGENALSKAAGVVVQAKKDRGYTIKTKGKSLFLLGKTDVSDSFAVYALLKAVLNYECYSSDEFVIAQAKTLYLPKLDISVDPDIAYMASPAGMVKGDYSSRMTYYGAPFIVPEGGGGAWHNSFDYIPPKDYQEDHPKWFATDGENLCLTAHGDAAEYEALLSTVVEKMENAITNTPGGRFITFTHQDNGTWCTCSSCAANKSKYGTDAATKIMFMNDVVDRVETWIKENCPERDNIRYIFFAYTRTRTAPVKEENGKIVPIDEKVTPNKKLGVMYAPIESDFFHGKTEPQNSSQYHDMKAWHALVGDNIFYWFYQAYFYNYFLFYDNFESMQDNYQAMKNCGATWIYDQSQWNNANSTGFQRLKVYLESKLSWDVNADITKLTDDFFKIYYKDAQDYMKQLFIEMRLNNLHMSENLGVGGWIGTRVNNSEYFKLNTLLKWESFIESAYKAIEKYKDTDPQLYESLSDRICLESLAVRFLIIDLYGGEVYTSRELYEQRVLFKADCAKLDITMYSEQNLISTLWASWGI